MDMTGEHQINAPRAAVWAALNDAEILKRSIAGCEELTKTADNEFQARVTAKVGPVKAKFTGAVELSDILPLESYRLNGEGQGGVAGFAKGGALVTLEAEDDATILRYEVGAAVGGKLAQLGARLIDSTALKLADQFFARFGETVAGGGDAP